MLVYRIAKTGYIRDLSGNGSRTFGGRWSPPGISVVYTSQSRSLAALEFYAHTNPRFIPPDLSIAEISIPDDIAVSSISLSDLPEDWYEYPAPTELQEYGSNWVNSGESLVLQVPSVQVRHEYNYLVNPAHSDMPSLQILSIDRFLYDRRLMKR